MINMAVMTLKTSSLINKRMISNLIINNRTSKVSNSNNNNSSKKRNSKNSSNKIPMMIMTTLKMISILKKMGQVSLRSLEVEVEEMNRLLIIILRSNRWMKRNRYRNVLFCCFF